MAMGFMRQLLSHFYRFTIVSALSFGLQIGLLVLLHGVIGLMEEVAFVLTMAVVFTVNFSLLRRFVYPNQTRSIHGQFIATLSVSLGFRVFEFVMFVILHRLAGIGYLFAATGGARGLMAGQVFRVSPMDF